MPEAASKSQVFVARLALFLIVAFAVLGALWYGFSEDVRQRIWQDLHDRPGGPMMFRFMLQPVMATIAAFHDGLKDAATGRSPYLWTVLTNQAERSARLSEGLISTGRVILLALGMDVIYQYVALKSFYPGEAVIVAVLLAFVPYLLLRGPIARIARRRRGGGTGGSH